LGHPSAFRLQVVQKQASKALAVGGLFLVPCHRGLTSKAGCWLTGFPVAMEGSRAMLLFELEGASSSFMPLRFIDGVTQILSLALSSCGVFSLFELIGPLKHDLLWHNLSHQR